MLAAVIATFALAPGLATVDLIPTDDIWAYPHASDPDSDPFLRVWGFEGQSVADSAASSESLGYSFLKFDLTGLPEKKLIGAELVLTHTAKPTFTLEMAKRAPLEVRPVASGFSEKTWTYYDLSKYMPAAGKEKVFGAGIPDTVPEDKDFPIRIDLMKGPGGFAKALEEARIGKVLGLALTTTLSPAEEARSVYKLYSKDGPKESRPVLKLTFAD